jgi:phage shock protein PspC (stress-responsive transcriptional regulator)
MKQVININFQGRVVPIEVSAFDLLKNYTESLSRYFANEEGKDEIINDIESRIGELFQERLKKGATCITDEDVNAIIQSMGRPEEFEGDESKVAAGLGDTNSNQHTGTDNQSAYGSNATGTGSTGHKRLYRDENNKIIGGVCGGLANYFGTDPVIIRVIFAVVALAFGTGLLAYIILWVAVPSTASTQIGGVRKKLFRDPDDKIIAGVCSGIGNYFGVSAWLPRILFLLPFLSFVFNAGRWGGFFDFSDFFRVSFSPGSLIVYIILWLAIPEASSTAEKLEMKGEKVDMNSIKNSVVEEMKGVQQRAEKFATEAKTVAGEKGAVLGNDIKNVAKKSGRSLGDVIIFLVKAFAYFIIGCVGFGLVIALFTLAIFSIGIFPLKDFVLTDGWQNAMAWGTLLFFIAVPVIGIITWIIRRLTKMRSNSNVLRFSFISLWILGWFCFINLIVLVGKDFKSINNISEQEITLSNPRVSKLVISNNSPIKNAYRYNAFRLEPFEGIEEDTAYIRNVEVKIVKSNSDSFRVTMIKMAHGRSKRFADTLANKITFGGTQQDSTLIIEKGIAINKQDKFRNQRIVLTVYVPVGKQIRIDRNIGWGNNVHFDGPWNEGNMYIDRDDEEHGWESDVTYVMNTDGLYTLDGRRAADYDNDKRTRVKIGPDGIEIRDNNEHIKIDKDGIRMNDENNTDNYRYNGNEPNSKADSTKIKLDAEEKRIKDSLEKEKQNIDKKLQKIDTKNTTSVSKQSGEDAVVYPTPLFVQLPGF